MGDHRAASANGVGLYQVNRSLKIASSTKVLAATRSVVNSRLAVARTMYDLAETIVSDVGPAVTEVVSMGLALRTECDEPFANEHVLSCQCDGVTSSVGL